MLHFDHTARTCVLNNVVEDTPLQYFLLSNLHSFDSIFLFWFYYSGIAWIDKLYNCVQGICFMVYQGNRKNTLPHVSWEWLQRGKNASSITFILHIRTTNEQIELTGWGAKREKNVQPRKVIFWEKGARGLKKVST